MVLVKRGRQTISVKRGVEYVIPASQFTPSKNFDHCCVYFEVPSTAKDVVVVFRVKYPKFARAKVDIAYSGKICGNVYFRGWKWTHVLIINKTQKLHLSPYKVFHTEERWKKIKKVLKYRPEYVLLEPRVYKGSGRYMKSIVFEWMR